MKTIAIKQGRVKYEIFRGDKQVSDHIELISIFIHSAYRQKGFGRVLIDKLIEIAKQEKIKVIIVKANTDGQSDIFGKFLIATGFEKTPITIFQKTINDL